MHCHSRDTADYVKTLTIDDKVDQIRDKGSKGELGNDQTMKCLEKYI